jgi:broad specificity phosphatase PhoE
MRLLLIRHGQSVGNAQRRMQGWSDIDLDETGVAQAVALGERLRCEHQVSALYTSTLRRAQHTAEVVGSRIGLCPQLDERFMEFDHGALTGMTFDEIEQSFPDIVKVWRSTADWADIPRQEDRGSFFHRVMAGIDDIVGTYRDGQEVAVVSHRGALSAIVDGLVGLGYRQRPPWHFDNASLSIVEVGGVRPRVVLLNDCSHLRERG